MQKIDLNKLDAYCFSLSEKLTNEFFTLNTNISGEQILKFTPIEQINLFVLKNLFDKWKQENVKLRSPYFNYDHDEVREALNNLLIKLSQHISVKKDDFILLLRKAIKDTFLILLDPINFLKNEYLNRETNVISELKETEKYIRINKSYLKSLIDENEGKNKFIVSKTEAEMSLHKISDSNSIIPEEADKYFNSFSALLKIELADILFEKPFVHKVKEEVLINEKEENIVAKVEPEIKKVEPVKNVQPEVKVPANDGMINERFAKEFITLNDKLKHEEGETIIQKHSKKKIAEIKEAITLNQKFIFIKELLNGDASEYNNLLNAIDQCENYQMALKLINENYAVKRNWNQEKPEVKEFYSIVDRKFN